MNDQIIAAWHINQRANLLLFDAITDEGLGATLAQRGGRTVALQFAHLHNVRLGWLEVAAADVYATQTKIEMKGVVTRELLRTRLEESAAAVVALLERTLEQGGKVRGFKRGAVPLMSYLIAHDAHHRGNILLTLKQCGHTVPQDVRFGIWEWDKL